MTSITVASQFAWEVVRGIPGWLAYLCPLLLVLPWLPGPLWLDLLAALVLSPAGLPILLGVVLISIQAILGLYTVRPSLKYPGRSVLAWRAPWMYLWSNEEDGIDGSANGFWPKPEGRFAMFKQIFAWSALRNSAGNARWLPFYGMTVDGSGTYVMLAGGSLKEGPYIARQGWRSEIRFCWNPREADWTQRRYFVCGWRIANTLAPESGVGFALQPRMTLT